MDLIYTESRKGQDLLSKLGVYGLWETVEGEREEREGSEEKDYSSIKNNKEKRKAATKTKKQK